MEQGLKITIRQSKTDQEGKGQTVSISNGKMNIVDVLNDWLAEAGISSGAIFRPINKGGKVSDNPISDKSVSNIVKKYAELAGYDPAELAGHSLRAGFIATAAEAGSNLFKIMDISRHKSVDTVRGYVRSAESFKDHAGSSFL